MGEQMPAKSRTQQLLRLILPAAIILVVAIVGLFGSLVYRVTHPGAVAEAAKPSHYLLPSLDVTFPSEEGLEIEGWWIPGLKGGPGIVLAPGIAMNRSDALSLALLLHEGGFNLLIYDE